MFLIDKWLKKEVRQFDSAALPKHIAIIMDGNGRWARKRGLPRNVGHKEGSKKLKKIVAYCNEIGIKYITVYAFSTENWKRPKSEVDGLMSLLLGYLKNAENELGGEKVRIRVIGNLKGLSYEIQKEVARVTEITKHYNGITLNIALNYGGRDDIIQAARSIARDVREGRVKEEDINEEMISRRLYTSDTPDPDLIIRTSGEQRLSNFLIWQAAYSEYWFTDVHWPDFKEEHINEAIKAFQKRNRRFGGV